MEAVLALKFSGEHYDFDLERAGMLIRSLERFWVDPEPLDVTIVVGRDDYDIACRSLASTKLRLTFLLETSLVPNLDDHPDAAGWRQQTLKLAFHRVAQGPYYLVLDADILCVQPVSSEMLVVEGKALTDWGPRSIHAEWWAKSALVLQLPARPEDNGMSVTPELLSKDICAMLEERISRIHGRPCYDHLLQDLGWTEYSLYSTFAMNEGIMHRHHHSAEWMERRGQALRTEHSLWAAEAFPDWRPEQAYAEGARGFFMVCQSRSRIPPDRIRARLAGLAYV